MDKYVELARKSIEYYFIHKALMPIPINLPKDMVNNKAGIFVSLHSKDGSLRGCIGTILPGEKTLANEIISNAVSAAFYDNRFSPLVQSELKDLDISVDVLTEPIAINTPDELDVKKYGVIVKNKNGQYGVLLPDISGVNSVEQQISIAAQKAGIDLEKDKIYLYRFEVIRHH
ncbi:MAG: AmmeMemoRadiSam system protein A [Patescibacteria group bacterium]|nr:AmmeMemoRadiSam system protein A [Patescibacteria group bacterium]MDD5121533.1 AmmeMemoRadiSam system protein A [Patescibacteria group bacterium]MDD5222105.1 AmmeMemoRadiSam system protein A [Patescibacteria group bacterium]MDD5396303.1 AmmeMemoRadiSam system protein A [Patescibacteria group bacterium]